MRFAIFAVLAVTVFAAPPAKTADPTFAPLWLYDGTWQVSRKDQPAAAKPDTLANQCALLGKYFTCSQVVNGVQQGLVVFLPASGPGRFYTQSIMPDGRATGRNDLQISGDIWTYTSRRDEGGKTTFYRTLNTFSGKTKIHFESSHSENNKDWTIDASGDEVRVGSK
jgi:hypothetical protein